MKYKPLFIGLVLINTGNSMAQNAGIGTKAPDCILSVKDRPGKAIFCKIN